MWRMTLNNCPSQTSEVPVSFARWHPCGSRPVRASALVRLGLAGLDGNTLPPPSADVAHRLAYLRHRHRVGSLVAVPAHPGRNVARSSSRYRTCTRAVSGACSGCSCISQPARLGRRWLCSAFLHGDTVRVSATLSSPDSDRSLVKEYFKVGTWAASPGIPGLGEKGRRYSVSL